MANQTVAYIGEASAQDRAFVCDLMQTAAHLGIGVYAAADTATGLQFLAHAAPPPAAVLLAPGAAQSALAKRVHSLVPAALIVCLNGCLQEIQSTLPAHVPIAAIGTADPSLCELLASALAGGQAITTRIADQAAVYLSAPGDAERAQIALDLLPAAVAYVDVEQCVRYTSRQWGTWFAIASGATCGRHLREVLDIGLYERVQGCLEAALQGAEATCEARFDGDGVRALSATFLPDHDRAGRVRGVVCFLQDVSERRRYEAHVLRGQKLESAATMAGGLAHDFNNLLTVILGNISLAALQANNETRLRASLGEAQEAIERARCLTRELLMFARVPLPVTNLRPIGPLLHESAGVAVRGSTARAEFILPDDLWPVDFDAELLGEALRSLMANAVQAMPLGGALRVVAQNVWLPEPGAGNRQRPYVKVSIVDRGIGIPEGHLSKIFDPYFTTKQAGSGLSLATAYAVIERHRGMVEVSSKMGAGTCVCVYLPVTGKGEASAAELDMELRRDQAPRMVPPLCENLATTVAAFVGVAAKAQGEA